MKKNLENKIEWQNSQDDLADKKGLAIVLLEDNSLSAIHASNNNSICQHLTSSEEFAPACQKFCGSVYEKAVNENKPLKYKCYAGLECVAVPVNDSEGKKLVAIIGRAFTKSIDYRKATERAISGDWSKFPPSKFFENILMTNSNQNIENLAKRIINISEKEQKFLTDIKKSVSPDDKTDKISNKIPDKVYRQDLSKVIENFNEQTENHNAYVEKIAKKQTSDLKDLNEWRSLFSSLLDLEYKQACLKILEFLGNRYGLHSLAWLENQQNSLVKITATGELKKQNFQISLRADDKRLLNAVKENSSVELRERRTSETEDKQEQQSIRLFPVAVGGKLQSALVLTEKIKNEKINRHISKFCQAVASELEILRLREELARRSWLGIALHKFNDSLKMIDTEDFWSRLLQTTAELLRAERGSLFIYDEKQNQLELKATTGTKIDAIKNQSKEKIGERVIKKVWKDGSPLVVPSISKIGLSPAPAEWKYKTESFICFPITIAGRKIGVINLTDKIEDGIYDDFDLQLLNSIAPQIAVAIDRANLKDRAGEFEQLSVTDALTGLLNRRYLEQRLAEELKRSNRHGYPMSFMMIDVDNFKSYNDSYSHPEGDKALKLVGYTLKETLRGADVAARYGGEEFSILLPQTNIEEAQTIAERIRKNIEDTDFPNRQVTISIGVSTASLEINSVEDLILAADKALFVAKDKGRNNVQLYGNNDRENDNDHENNNDRELQMQ